ncbi:MAG TPA: hypothetical protein VK712_01190 [Verrucomicrobiae bacterium]|jgi:hypothetical protein|nr:hypothetical protein [Verrucomicrobiae bacterium]
MAREAAKRIQGLPVLVTSPLDVARLVRELEAIDEALLQLGLRQPGAEVKMPKTSRLMDQVILLNELNLLYPEDRLLLQQFLRAVKERAPVVHMSFNADPPVAFMEKLVAWLRREINPLVLVTVGLQPNMGAGCMLRTTNRQFDFSLRQTFLKNRELLISKLMSEEQAA